MRISDWSSDVCSSDLRDLGISYVQTGLAIDPHTPASGGMRFVPNSHLCGDLEMEIAGPVLAAALADDALRAVGLDPASAVALVLAPGDLALWSPYPGHGSGMTRSDHPPRPHLHGSVPAPPCPR